ncbi:hypothetical protein HK101_007699 [Irineochytrium annulatum]|nr:hypothetical protein HK101_007699 [Irineochytrium annulatum]
MPLLPRLHLALQDLPLLSSIPLLLPSIIHNFTRRQLAKPWVSFLTLLPILVVLNRILVPDTSQTPGATLFAPTSSHRPYLYTTPTTTVMPAFASVARARELRHLTAQLLHTRPLFQLVVGPPSTGKTTLISQVLGQRVYPNATKGDLLFHPIHLNLRSLDVTSPHVMRNALWKAGEALREVGGVRGEGLMRLAERLWAGQSKMAMGQEGGGIVKGLEFLAEGLVTREDGGKPVVLVVDEAGELRNLKERDFETWRSLLKFCVRMSKEEGRMHVVFTTSDSNYHDWMPRESAHYNTIFLGDLPKEEAKSFYDGLVAALPDPDKRILLEKVDFEDVFDLTGGRMMFIESYVNDVAQFGPIKKATDFRPVANALDRLLILLSGPHGFLDARALLRLFRTLVTHPNYLDFHDLVTQFGCDAVDEMIRLKLVMYRPLQPANLAEVFARDLMPVPGFAVVEPLGRPDVKAMEALIARIDGAKVKPVQNGDPEFHSGPFRPVKLEK